MDGILEHFTKAVRRRTLSDGCEESSQSAWPRLELQNIRVKDSR